MNFSLWKKVCFFQGVLVMFTISCLINEGFSAQYKTIEDVPHAEWEVLAKKKFYFAHQSVGKNIVGGLKEVIQTHPEIKLHIVEGHDDEVFNQPVFAHSKSGKNRKPLTKIKAFTDVIDDDSGSKIDVAFMKLCYVDVTADETDIDELFAEYVQSVAALQARHLDLTIIHFTVPLCTVKKTWKTNIKMLMVKEPWELVDNVKRNEYNALLRGKYGDSGNLFDIAMLQSTKPDGTPQKFTYKDKKYSAMVPEYSDDGGHLNSVGSKMIAENFLLFLLR